MKTKLSGSELRVLTALWERGPATIRELLDAVPGKRRLAYTTMQTLVYRLEEKGAVRRTRKIGGAHVFEATVTRVATQYRLLDDLLDLFGGQAQPLMSHLIDSGKLSLEDIDAARERLRQAEAAAAMPKSPKKT